MKLKCKRVNCGYEWKKKKREGLPITCPRCSSPYWRGKGFWQRLREAWGVLCGKPRAYKPRRAQEIKGTITLDNLYHNIKQEVTNDKDSNSL